MKRLFYWLKKLDEHILEILTLFLLVFIPLYPKFPLFEILPGYIVRVRLEDFLVAGTVLIWLVWLWRGKISFGPNPLTKPILVYLSIGFLSMISAVFITQTVPFQNLHLAKMFLHYLRRIEYFSLFFIFYSTIKSLRQVKFYLLALILTLIGIIIYGYGQKYLYWPAFSTMNREFSKGWMLYLTEHARVISSFAGHYDLAAFTMMTLILLWSLFFGIKNKILKIIILLILVCDFWLLILTASRTSFLAYLFGIFTLFFFWSFKNGLGWGFSRWLGVTFLSILIMLSFGDLSDRFTRLLRLDERFGGLKEVLFKPFGEPPREKAVFLSYDEELSKVATKSDQQPVIVKPGTGPLAQKPADVNEDVPVIIEEKLPSGEVRYIARQRTYSQTALRFDLSTGIRLDALWPRAWQAFLKNPLLGTGYSTLGKTQVEEFTEAESTDNDYLRALGETGILGLGSFLAILGIIIFFVFKNLGGLLKDNFVFSLVVGLTAIIFGLLVNAIYIDIFEASKIAFSFWALMGILLATIKIKKEEIENNKQPLYLNFDFKKTKEKIFLFFKSDLPWLILILFISFYLRTYRLDNPIADWHSWRQADTSAVTRNFFKENRINLLYPTYDDLSSVASGKPNPKGLRLVEFPLYNAVSFIYRKIFPEGSLEESQRIVSIIFSCFSLIFLFYLVKKYLGRRQAYFTAIFFALLPFNIYYSRTILPEPMMVCLSLGMIYFFDKWLEREQKFKYYFISLIFAASAILVKPYAVFLFLPLVYLCWQKFGLTIFKKISLYTYFLIAVVPFLLWRIWISQFPEGIPAFWWLLNGDGIRFKGAFFWWIFAERIGRLILGVWGLPLLIFGILSKQKKEGWFFYFWLVAILLYLIVFATGNVRHDYYQVLTVPIICVFLAKGNEFLISEGKEFFNKFFSFLILVICFFFMLAFSWYQVRDFFNINHPEIIEAGRAIDQIAHRRALVIAPYDGDTAFLYQTNRAGWPIIDGSIEKMIEQGADYYVSVRRDEITKNLIKEALTDPQKNYKIIKDEKNFVIIQLVPDAGLPKD